MIAELLFTVDLLKKLSLRSTPSTSQPPPPPQPPSFKPEKPPDTPQPIFEVDPEVFADVLKFKRYF